jgi:hypothetical protein
MWLPRYVLRQRSLSPSTPISALLAAAAALLLAGCPKSEAPAPETRAEPAETSTTSQTPAESPPELAEGWTQIPAEAPPEDAKDALALAREAKKALGSRLMKRLTAAVGEGDFAKGVEVCEEAAPAIAEQVSEDREVEVGRTSFAVRNPDNRPEAFMKPIVEARYAEEILMRGPDGQVAYMAPIRLGEVCVNCHGTEAQIPDEVENMLARLYPEDEATGFAPGDLRGWFHVTMPASSSR